MRSGRATSIIVGVLLATILLVSLGLRVWGGGFGLPAYTRYHPDEHALVDRAAAILWTGDWNLQRFNYPPFYAYLQAGAYATYFLWGAARGWWNEVPAYTLPQYYQVGRLLTALAAAATILVVYLAGRQLRGRRLGLLSAALLGGCYLHIIHSHYATFDVMVGLLAILTYLFSERIRTTGEAKWYLLAGLAAGLAGATKYNGALVFVVPLVAHVLVTPWGEWGWLNRGLFIAIGGFLLGFFGGNPFALGNLPDFLKGLATVLHHYGSSQPGFEGSGNWRWYLTVLLTSADAIWVVAGTVGMALMVWQERRKGLLLVVFPILYLLAISQFTVRFERNIVPVLPFLALGGGWFLDWTGEWLVQRFGRGPGVSNAIAALGLLLLVSLPLVAGVLFDMTIARTDLREVAGRWLMENAEPGSKIAVEHYSIPFDQSQYQIQDVMRISDHDLDWYQQQGFDLFIVSDGVWDLLRSKPKRYAAKVGVYDQLTSGSTLLAEFRPQPPGLVIAGYPTVRIYHFAPVRVYEIPR